MRKRRVTAAVLGTFTFTVLAALPFVACSDDLVDPGGDAVISIPFSFERDATGRTGYQLTGVNGTITITGSSQGEAVLVNGFRRVRDCSQSAADALIGQFQVEVTETATHIVIRTDQPVDASGCNLVVDYDLTVPERLMGTIVSVNGVIAVDDVDGGLDITSINGTVELADVEDDTRVRLTNGTIQGNIRISDEEEIDLLTVNGSIDLTIPTTTDAELSIALANGIITVSNLTIDGAVTTSTSVSGTLGTGEGSIILRTTNGNITLRGG
jgi:DUF4097 and DUF4098 domain-containing protein YvlB